MSIELSKLVSKALSQGYQVDPAAFTLISELQSKVDPETLIEKAIQWKMASNSKDRLVTEKDLESVLPPDLVPSESSYAPLKEEDIQTDIEVLSDPTQEIAPIGAEPGFKKLFADRYSRLVEIAKMRPDYKTLGTFRSAGKADGKNKVRVAGLLSSRTSKKGGGMDIVLDDPAGSLRISCVGDAATSVSKIPLDSLVIARISGSPNKPTYVDEIGVPDIPVHRPVTSSHKVYAILLSDLHIGSQMFLEDDFKRLILWLNRKLGELEIVNRVKYVIIAGDVVDGVGVYPGQESQLTEKDLKKQYLMASLLIDQIPKHMQILISPGNHDPVRQALPQPAIAADVAETLYKMENVRLLGNPSYVKLHGATFLIYHGRSLDDIIATVPDLSYNRPASAMQVLLKVRHLAPTYGKRTSLSPELRDMLVIDPVPDVFHSGHVHTLDVLDYRGTVIANSGTWQSQTPFQANMGLEPTPAIVPLIELSTLEVTRRNFTKASFS